MEDINLSETPKKEEIKMAVKSNNPSFSVIEEKIDKILRHQKTVRNIAIFRGIITFIFFLTFILLPLLGGLYLFQFVKTNVDFEKISGQYQDFYESMDQIKSTSDTVGGLSDTINNLKNGIIKGE